MSPYFIKPGINTAYLEFSVSIQSLRLDQMAPLRLMSTWTVRLVCHLCPGVACLAYSELG